MIPYKTIIKINRKGRQAIYLQLSNQFIQLIKEGVLPPNTRLPGSRTLAELLGVHRKTIVACYDELALQGWIESEPQKGTYVNKNIPLLQQQKISDTTTTLPKLQAGFSFVNRNISSKPFNEKKDGFVYFNDGVSDERLSPTEDIAKIYRSIASKKNISKYLTYGTTYGNKELRDVLTTYLNETRGLHITRDNILITRGSQMGIYLSSKLLFQNQDYIIVGETNYISADLTFEQAGATMLKVKVDKNGLDTDAIEKLCKKHPIKAVYVTPHHHHPSTVTLSANRRMHLLNLAQSYNFAIIEDDYDYDFHYNHAPILPLASHDKNGNVIYIGSICKTVAPVYRIGYLIAPKQFVDECAKLRRFIDRQGDALLELTFANFIKNGDLDRHIKKVLKIYKERRDLFCKLLDQELGEYLTFEIPKGGMAIWATLNKKYTWRNLIKEAEKQQLIIGDWRRYDTNRIGHNAIRIGFASYSEKEIYTLIDKLKTSFELAFKN